MELPKFLTNPDPEVYLRGEPLILDFETTTYGKGLSIYSENRIVLAVWKFRGETKVRRAGEYELQELVRDCESADFIVAQNAKFELGWLARCGLDLTNILVYDTQIGEYVIGGNRWVHQQVSLESCGQRWFGEGKIDLIKKMWDAGFDTDEIPESWLEEYCIRDVELTERLFLNQREYLHENGLLPVMYNRCLLTPVLTDIEKNGVCLDPDLVYAKSREVEAEYADSCRRLEQITGGINTNSTAQLAEYLYSTLGFEEVKRKRAGKWVPVRTDNNNPKTDAETVMKLKPKNKKQRVFLETYKRNKELFNELSKYLGKMRQCCEESDGILHASFNQTATRTHRLSSSGLDYNIQFQNFPRAYKPLFKARTEGWLVGEADGAQLEFRTAIHLGRDPVGLSDILDPDFDAHVFSGATIADMDYFSVLEAYRSEEKWAKEIRQGGKADTFGPLYGKQSGTWDQQRYFQAFRERYSKLNAVQQEWVDTVLENKKLRTEWGLVYYWPDTTMDRSGYIKNTTSIYNYAVQAFATAEIIPLGLVWFWHKLKRSNLRMYITNTVHDSIIVELPEDEVDVFHELSKTCLIDGVYDSLSNLYDIDFCVPLGAGVTTGTHWNVGEETLYNAPEELWREAAVNNDMVIEEEIEKNG